jgi:endoglucanase
VNLTAGTATGAGTDTLSLIENVLGGSGNDILTGNAVNNALWGGSGNDIVDGASGNDIVDGGAGNDLLYGAAGSDRLDGGLGADQLSGGISADTFVFGAVTDSSAVASDTITDFATNVDKIDVSGIDADGDLSNGITAFNFKAVTSLPTALTKGNLYYVSSSKQLVADVSGDGAADFKVNLGGSSTNVVATDLIGVNAPAPSRALQYEGVNLPGGAFFGVNGSAATKGDRLAGPETNWVGDYFYNSPAALDYFISKGMNLFRVGFKAKRLLDPATNPADDFAKIDALVAHAAKKGAVIELAMMDFGYTRTGLLIGRDPGSVAEFAEQWRVIADRYKDAPNVMFNLMNEPWAQTATQWLAGAQAAVDAIRAAGATKQKIIVPGSYWDHASQWTTLNRDIGQDNATVMFRLEDPLPVDNFAFEVHQYFSEDQDWNGTPYAGYSIDKALGPITRWARDKGVELFLGEWGFAPNAASMAAGKEMNDFIHQNSDVWAGSTYWAAVGGWDHRKLLAFEIMPDNIANPVDKPQMAILAEYLPHPADLLL